MAADITGYAELSGMELYFEIRGSGFPLLLLHEALGSIESFAPIVSSLAAKRRVIAADLQGHGQTADIDRPLSYRRLADDVAALLGHLGTPNADLLGYSLGGEVALQAAIRHPRMVRKLVLISAAFRRDGWHREVLASQARLGLEEGEAAALHDSRAVARNHLNGSGRGDGPGSPSTLIPKLRQLLAIPYDWTEDVRRLSMPILAVFGDEDAVGPAHAVELFGLLGGGKGAFGWPGVGHPHVHLAILPRTTHFDVLRSSALPAILDSFLG